MAPKTNMPVPSSPFDDSDNTRHLAASVEGIGPHRFPNARWIRYCQIKSALRSKSQNDPTPDNQSAPTIPTSPSGLPGENYRSIPPGSSLTSAPAGAPFHPRPTYSSKGIQTTPSLAMAKCPSSVVEISEEEEERFNGTPPKAKIDGQNSSLIGDRRNRRVIIESDSSASDDDCNLKMPGAYPPSNHSTSPEPVARTPVYVPRWLTSPTHTPTPAQRQPFNSFARVARAQTPSPSHPKNASPHTSVDSD